MGTLLGDAYRIGRRIADGGMGTLYEARHVRLERRCAVKVLAPELAANREAVARFHREAEITSQLAHPHIIHVLDFGLTPAGAPYLAMEFLEGEDLARRLRRAGRLPLDTTVRIVRQVASGLAATHARDIVHRDLKPANIFLMAIENEPDFVKVVDFGISKIRNATSKLTRASVLMGTPSYMAPEQANGRVEAIDHRTDQWALACIAWEMLAGQSPFVARDLTTLLYQVVNDDPPSLAARTRPLPPEVEQVLRRALSKRQGDRFGSIAAFARALEAAAAAPVVSDGAGRAEPGRTGAGAGAAARSTWLAALTRGWRPQPPAAIAPPPPPTALVTRLRALAPRAVWSTIRLRWRGKRRLARWLVGVPVAVGALLLIPPIWHRGPSSGTDVERAVSAEAPGPHPAATAMTRATGSETRPGSVTSAHASGATPSPRRGAPSRSAARPTHHRRRHSCSSVSSFSIVSHSAVGLDARAPLRSRPAAPSPEASSGLNDQRGAARGDAPSATRGSSSRSRARRTARRARASHAGRRRRSSYAS